MCHNAENLLEIFKNQMFCTNVSKSVCGRMHQALAIYNSIVLINQRLIFVKFSPVVLDKV